MKIKKTLFKTEISIRPDELSNFIHYDRFGQISSLFRWIKKNFKLDLFPKKNDL